MNSPLFCAFCASVWLRFCDHEWGGFELASIKDAGALDGALVRLGV
jgi:hypothetical protein